MAEKRSKMVRGMEEEQSKKEGLTVAKKKRGLGNQRRAEGAGERKGNS